MQMELWFTYLDCQESPSVGQPVQDAKYAYHAKLASCVYNVWFQFATTNRVDSDEMLHYAASHQDLYLFDLILYVPSTIFQLNRDGFSWVEPVLS